MNSSALHPPNAHALSDRVISKVVQRVHLPSVHCTTAQILSGDGGSSTNKFSTNVLSGKSRRFRHARGSAVADSDEGRVPQVQQCVISADQRKTLSNPLPTNSHAELRPEAENEEVELRRKRGRLNMQKYRKTMNDRATNLEHNIEQLREEIKKLQLERQTVSLGFPTGTTALVVAAEYFRLFRNGLKTLVPASTTAQTPSVCNAQRDFLYAAMTADVVGETGFGVERLIEDYRRLALCFPESDTQLVHLEMVPGDRIIATTTLRITITPSALHYAFPQLVSGASIGAHSEKRLMLAAKSLNQRFVMRGSIHFKWDNMTHRMSLVQSRADLLTPMLQFFGDLETVACLFEKARVTSECKLVY